MWVRAHPCPARSAAATHPRAPHAAQVPPNAPDPLVPPTDYETRNDQTMPPKRIETLDRNFKAPTPSAPTRLKWLSATDPRLTVRGLHWFKENGGSFSRLPLRAEKIVREEVWMLAQCPASARICFRS